MAEEQKPEANPYASIYADALKQSAPEISTPPPAPEPTAMQTIGQGATDLGRGVLQSGVNTLHGIGTAEHALMPQSVRSTEYGKNFEAGLGAMEDYAKPEGWMQGIGKGLGDVAQFFIPGGAEADAAAKLPMLGRFAKPLMSMIGGEAVNEAQGGPAGAGAVGSGVGSAVGAGMRAVAPYAAETAMRIPTIARAFGKTPGKAILEETSGILPSTVGKSAQEATNRMTGEVEQAADAASVRPNRIRGLLPAPTQEVPLAPSPAPRNPKTRPMAFNAEVNPEEPNEPRSGNPMADISEYPGINPHYLSGSEHPELSGRVTPLQNPQQVTTRMGVLLRPFQDPGGAPISPTEANPLASLRGARGILADAASGAARENAPTRFAQIQPMADQLSQRFNTGAPIPENITPRELLDLKRGFSDEHLGRWNPDLHAKTTSAGRQAYHAMDQEFDRTVPGAEETNQKISSLIPVIHAADKIDRAPGLFQRTAGRLAAHTGALTMGGMGAVGGYHAGGLPGAIAGGAAGLLGPELLASPESQMIAARTLGNKTLQGAAPPLASDASSKLLSYIRDRKKEGEE